MSGQDERPEKRGRRGCTSDLSRDPATVAGYGPLPCEVTRPHEVHERWSAPMAALWADLPGGGRTIEFMRPAPSPCA